MRWPIAGLTDWIASVTRATRLPRHNMEANQLAPFGPRKDGVWIVEHIESVFLQQGLLVSAKTVRESASLLIWERRVDWVRKLQGLSVRQQYLSDSEEAIDAVPVVECMCFGRGNKKNSVPCGPLQQDG